MTERQLQLVSDFIRDSSREELEIMMYSVFSDWPYEKIKAFGRAANIRIRIDGLEAEKRNTIYKGVKNPKMKLADEPNGLTINQTLEQLRADLKEHMKIFKDHKVTQ